MTIINKLRKQLEKSSNKKSSNYGIWLKQDLEREKLINEARIANATQEAVIQTLELGVDLIKKIKDNSSEHDDNDDKEEPPTDECSEDYIINIIKDSAVDLHEKMLLNNNLSDRNRKIMTNGISSILDLNDSSINSQRSLFRNDDTWDILKERYSNKHSIKKTSIPSSIKASWKIIIGSIKKSGDLNKGLKYINSIYYNTTDEDQYMLDIYSHLIKCIKFYPEYLSTQKNIEILENDYIRILWSPLLEALFVTNKSIRIICSESCNAYTADRKKHTYNEADKVIGFKIDVRIVFTYEGVDYDLVCGEAACHAGDGKVISDEGKLNREGKDIQDQLIDLNCVKKFPWLIQLVGHFMDFSTLHLSSPGLYVNVPRFNASLPATILELEQNVPTILCDLLTFRGYVIDLSESLIYNLRKKISSLSSLGKKSNINSEAVSEMHYWKRPTYYTPPKDMHSKVPTRLYGIEPPASITERLIKASFVSDGDVLPEELPEELNDVCEYGWLRKGGRFYNLYSKEYSDSHFCCQN